MGIRDIKRKARTKLHRAMQVAGLYLFDDDDPKPVSVRVHYDFRALGDLAGTSYNFADRQETMPKIVFLAAEVAPVRGAIVSVEAGEAYRVDNVLPKDDLTITAEVLRMTASEIAKEFPTGQPVPA